MNRDHEPSRWSDFFDDLAPASDDYADPVAHAAMLEAHARNPFNVTLWLVGAVFLMAVFGVFKVAA